MPDTPANPPLKILLVDDHPIITQLLAEYLRETTARFDVFTATTGEAALQQCDAEPPDLLVLDLRLPGLSGLEVIHELRRRGGATRILVCSDLCNDFAIESAFAAGANGFFEKTDHPAAIAAAITSLSNGIAPGTPAVDRVLREMGLREPRAPHLSLEDLRALRLFAQGRSPAFVAATLGLTRSGAYTARRRVARKLGSAAEIRPAAVRLGLAPADCDGSAAAWRNVA